MTHDELDRVRNFRDERLTAIGNKDPVVVFHLVPAVLAPPQYCDLSKSWEKPLPLLTGGGNSRYNHIGHLVGGDKGHVQIFHNGSIEVADRSHVVGDFHPKRFAKDLVNSFSRCYACMKELLNPRFATNTVDVVAMLSILGAVDHRFALHQESEGQFEENEIKLPEHVFTLSRMDERRETVKPGQEDDRPSQSQKRTDATKHLRPILDRLWNAGGLARCDLYDDAGIWTAG